MKRLLAVGVIAGLTLVGCSHSGSPFTEAQSGLQSGLQSGAQSGVALVEESELHAGIRETRFPLTPVSIDGIPFDLWLPYDALNSVSVLDARDSVVPEVQLSDVVEVPQSLQVLDIFEDGTVFAAEDGMPGVWQDDAFRAVSSLATDATTLWLPEGTRPPDLRAVSGTTSGPVAVWLETDEQAWSLLGWNKESNVLVELASSNALEQDLAEPQTGVSEGQLVEAGAAFALFQLDVSETIAANLEPGMYFREWVMNSPIDEWQQSSQSGQGDGGLIPQQSGRENPSSEQTQSGGDAQSQGRGTPEPRISAGFTVSMLDPGFVQYVGPGEYFAVDTEFSGGAYWPAVPELSDSGEVIEESDYTMLFTLGTGQVLPEAGAPSFVVWSDADAQEPLFGVDDSALWSLGPLAASSRYLAVQVDGPDAEGAWVVVWDLVTEEAVTVVSVARAAELAVSGERVLWAQEGQAFHLDVPTGEITFLGQASLGMRVAGNHVALLDESGATVGRLPAGR